MALQFSPAKHVLISWTQDRNDRMWGCWRPHNQSCIHTFSRVQSAFMERRWAFTFHNPLCHFGGVCRMLQSGFHLALGLTSCQQLKVVNGTNRQNMPVRAHPRNFPKSWASFVGGDLNTAENWIIRTRACALRLTHRNHQLWETFDLRLEVIFNEDDVAHSNWLDLWKHEIMWLRKWSVSKSHTSPLFLCRWPKFLCEAPSVSNLSHFILKIDISHSLFIESDSTTMWMLAIPSHCFKVRHVPKPLVTTLHHCTTAAQTLSNFLRNTRLPFGTLLCIHSKLSVERPAAIA